MTVEPYQASRITKHRTIALRAAGFCLIGFLWIGLKSAPTPAADLETQLFKHAPDVLKYLQNKGYKNVGVLKFTVKRDTESGQNSRFTDRAGAMNSDVAQRLEMALVLANHANPPIGIVHNASQVTVKTPGANHLTPAGRKVLFTPKYPLAWGSREVPVDAFVVGSIELDSNLRQMAIRLAAFDASCKLDAMVEFPAAVEAEDLAEAGESFLVRGSFETRDLQRVARTDAVKVHQALPGHPHPLQAADAPVELQVHYNNQPVAIELRDGKAMIREPHSGDAVSFLLKRRDPHDRHRYGCVLKVNGRNTLEKSGFATCFVTSGCWIRTIRRLRFADISRWRTIRASPFAYFPGPNREPRKWTTVKTWGSSRWWSSASVKERSNRPPMLRTTMPRLWPL